MHQDFTMYLHMRGLKNNDANYHKCMTYTLNYNAKSLRLDDENTHKLYMKGWKIKSSLDVKSVINVGGYLENIFKSL